MSNKSREVIRSFQYNAALAITRALIETSKEKLSGIRRWFIKGQRMVKVPVLFYKVVSTKVPPYLYEILSPFQRSQRNSDCFKPLNMSNWTLSKFWNKLDPDVRNVRTYSLFRKNLLTFIRPIENSIYRIYDSLGIKLFHRLRLGFCHLHEYNFRHNFADTVNPLCSCYLETESTECYPLSQLCNFRKIFMNESDSIKSKFNTYGFIRIILYADKNFDNDSNYKNH